jgi:hypothetical protein
MAQDWPPTYSRPGLFSAGRGPQLSIAGGGGGNSYPAAASDITAPTLTNFAATPGADDRWGEMTVDTNEDNGTIYWIVQAAATATPSAAQVIAGQDGAGAAATFAGSSAVSATGTYTKRATGLTAGTAYEACVVHQDAATNNSDVGSSLFSTDTLVASAITDGTATNMTATNGAFGTAVADSDGGANAISLTDSGDTLTGGCNANRNSLTYFAGVNRFRLKLKAVSSAAAKMWWRTSPASTTITGNTSFNLTDGTVGTEAWIGTPTLTSLGGGWYQMDGSLDMTGADVTGPFNGGMGDADNDGVVHLYDLRITRTT